MSQVPIPKDISLHRRRLSSRRISTPPSSLSTLMSELSGTTNSELSIDDYNAPLNVIDMENFFQFDHQSEFSPTRPSFSQIKSPERSDVSSSIDDIKFLNSLSFSSNHERRMADSRKGFMDDEDPNKCLFHCCVVGDLLTTQWLVEHRGAIISYSISPNDDLLPSRFLQEGDTPLVVADRYNNTNVVQYLRNELSAKGIKYEDISDEVDGTEKAFQFAMKSVSRTMKKKVSGMSRRPSEPSPLGEKLSNGEESLSKPPLSPQPKSGSRTAKQLFRGLKREPSPPPQRGNMATLASLLSSPERKSSQTPSPPMSLRIKNNSKDRHEITSPPFSKKGSGSRSIRQSRPRPLSPSIDGRPLKDKKKKGSSPSPSPRRTKRANDIIPFDEEEDLDDNTTTPVKGSSSFEEESDRRRGSKTGKQAKSPSIDLSIDEFFGCPRSIDFLLDSLCSKKQPWKKLLQVFFLTYIIYSSWEDVVRGLISRWNELTSSCILEVFNHWVSIYQEDWDAERIKMLFHIIKESPSIDDEEIVLFQNLMFYRSNYPEPIDVLTIQRNRKRRGEKRKSLSDIDKMRRQAKKKKDILFVGDPSDWMTWDEAMVAEQLSAYNWELLSSVHPREFILWNLNNSSERKKKCPNLFKFNKYFDKLAYWVISEVTIRIKLSQRIIVLEKFITIAFLSLHINNFFGAKALFTGVTHPAVSRMKKTLGGLSRETKSRFTKLHRILEIESNNGSSYRSALKTARPPFVPYIGLHQKDMTFVNDAAPTFVSSSSSTPVFLPKSSRKSSISTLSIVSPRKSRVSTPISNYVSPTPIFPSPSSSSVSFTSPTPSPAFITFPPSPSPSSSSTKISSSCSLPPPLSPASGTSGPTAIPSLCTPPPTLNSATPRSPLLSPSLLTSSSLSPPAPPFPQNQSSFPQNQSSFPQNQSSSPPQEDNIQISKFLNLWGQVNDMMCGLGASYDPPIDLQVREKICNPPNLAADLVFEWSNRAEPKDVEVLISDFIQSENRLNQNLDDLTLQLKSEKEKTKKLEEESSEKDQTIAELLVRIETLSTTANGYAFE